LIERQGGAGIDRDGAGVGDDVVVDLGGAADRNRAGIVQRAGVVDDEVGAGRDRDAAGVGDVLVVELIAGVGDRDGAAVDQGAVGEHGGALQVHDARHGAGVGAVGVVGMDVDGALVDAGGVDVEGAVVLDRDGAGVVGDRAVLIERQGGAGIDGD